jgi:hypothetical protein
MLPEFNKTLLLAHKCVLASTQIGNVQGDATSRILCVFFVNPSVWGPYSMRNVIITISTLLSNSLGI